MDNIIYIEKAIIATLTEVLNVPIFTNVPYGYKPPYVEIKDIGTSDWLIKPKSAQISLTVKVYSNSNNNIEVVNQFNKIKQTVNRLDIKGLIRCQIQWESCYLDKNCYWIGETEIKLYLAHIEKNEEQECIGVNG